MSKFFKYSLPIGIAGIVLSLILFITNSFYELVIPVFEKTMDDGSLFTFIDNLIFYTPLILVGLFAAYIVAGIIYTKKTVQSEEYKITVKSIAENVKAQKELDEKAEYLTHSYYRNCPSCGSVRADGQKVCAFCGTSLIKE